MPKRLPLILSIDCGSTNLKAGLFDEGLHRLAEDSLPVIYSVRDAERVEFDAEKMWHTTVALIRHVCAMAGIQPVEITRIALTSQAQTFTILDAAGSPLMPFLSWADKRAVTESAELAEQLGAEFHLHCSFPAPSPQLQLLKVLWVQHHHPEWFSLDSRMVSLPEFVALRLAGIQAIDRNLASMSGLYSLQRGDWWSDAVRSCGLRNEQLPLLVDTGASRRAKKPCDDIVFSPKLEIVFAGNDQTAGAFGNACHSDKMIVTLGTALVVYRYAGDEPGPYSPGGCWGPYPGGGFYELATRDEGCAALDWARSQLMPEDDMETFMGYAESSSFSGGDAFSHSLYKGETEGNAEGERIFFYPERMGTEGAWVGKGDLAARVHSVLEGISFTLRRLIVEELQAGARPSSICVIGGGSNSRFWLQLLADILNCPVRRGEGDTLLGAAMMAIPEAVPPAHSTSDVLKPDPSRAALYEDLYRNWLANL